jgi:hypothetical protein
MALDAFVTDGVIIVIPAQNSFIPPPVPVDSTMGVLYPLDLPKRSATTVVNGYTVDEPTTLIGNDWARTVDVNKTAHKVVISFFILFSFVKINS